MAASQPYIEHEHYYESEWPSRPAQALSYPLDSQLFYVLYAILLGLSSIWWYPSDAWSSLFSGWEGLLVGHQLLFVFYLTRLLIGGQF